MKVVASLSQGRTAAAQCGFLHTNQFLVIFEPPFTKEGDVLRDEGRGCFKG